MALADIPSSGQSRRLDSWKEIAEYLGRDVRTATRWEAQGMPLHRVPGGKGASVFAFTDEIDAWMAGGRPEPEPRPERRSAQSLTFAEARRRYFPEPKITGLSAKRRAGHQVPVQSHVI